MTSTLVAPLPPQEAALLAQVEQVGARLAQEPAWLQGRRSAARSLLAERGLPTTRDEAWRYTNIKSLLAQSYQLSGEGTVTTEQLAAYRLPGATVLIFVNGRFAPALSDSLVLPDGCGYGSLDASIQTVPERWESLLTRQPVGEMQAFEALTEAGWEGGAFLWLAAGVELEQPLQIIHVLAGEGVALLNLPRTALVLEAGAKATVIQTAAGLATGPRLHCSLTEIHLSEGATLDHYYIQRQRSNAAAIGTIRTWQESGSRYDCDSVTLGGALIRTSLQVTLQGPGADCELNGLYLLDGDRHSDLVTLVDHAAPHTTSRQRFKGILADQSHGVFTGKVIVRPDAQKISAEQSNPNLLLSDEATINSQPQLEIYADDVKCSHGATIGQLEEDALFYLRSRGIGMEAARAILTYAFAADVLANFAHPGLRQQLGTLLVGELIQGTPPEDLVQMLAAEALA
ncbi:MAG: FeS cluster assembly protein SufD [bacterium]|nr:FeS cluster assembly protein SufD [bacterium]